jgi:DUF2970 family protein
MPEPPSDPGALPPALRPATLRQVVTAVLWSFFGIRKGSAMRQDAVTLRPQHVIVVGVVLATLFVLMLLALVRLIVTLA